MRSLRKLAALSPRATKVSFLVNVGACDFVEMKKALGLTDGHMSTHMKELVNSGYVEIEPAYLAEFG
ncbi:MAG: hypothetical protein A4S09_05970 [Proteobacteria bacterium SG_bin7]|nr:MAG: hypothetical protein A4S09_05970 [Proteobacteria bacterium SG_bin7]